MPRASHQSLAVEDVLRAGTRDLGIVLEDGQVHELVRYLDELETWNSRLNLVGQHDQADLVRRHLVDSLAAVALLKDLRSDSAIADLGSGAGLPGVPLAIALRPARTLLVEPRRKRASFLRAVRRALPDVPLEVTESRAEELTAQDAYHSSFDAIVSRAALTDDELLHASLLLLRPGGLLIAYRGTQHADVSSTARPARGFTDPRVVPYRLSDPARQFNLVVWERDRFT